METKKRLIDANAFIENHCKDCPYRLEDSCTDEDPICSTIIDMEDFPTVDPMEVCIQEVIGYIDRAFDRQRYDSIWLDEKGERHSADVGYSGEWWEDCMKPELLRMFSNVSAKMDGDGNEN